MKKSHTLVIAALLLVPFGNAMAATSNATTTLSATIGNAAKLSLDTSSISLASGMDSADPDTTPTLDFNPVTITAKVRANGTTTLTVKAGGDLASGTNTIPLTKITMTASGTNYSSVNPTTSEQQVASFSGSSGSAGFSGTNTFHLANDWSYIPSSTPYTTTITYALATP